MFGSTGVIAVYGNCQAVNCEFLGCRY